MNYEAGLMALLSKDPLNNSVPALAYRDGDESRSRFDGIAGYVKNRRHRVIAIPKAPKGAGCSAFERC